LPLSRELHKDWFNVARKMRSTFVLFEPRSTSLSDLRVVEVVNAVLAVYLGDQL